MSQQRTHRCGARRISAIAAVTVGLATFGASAGTCITSGPAWQNVAFPAEPGVFSFTFDATPAAAPIDVITAISSGAGATFDDFACLIRFGVNGLIDVRNGDVYGRDMDVSYAAGQSFHFRVEIDVEAHTYTVFVTPDGADELLIACGYDFRTSQQSVENLDHWATWASDGFEHETCDAVADSGDGTTINVPDDAPWIQAAIDGASSGAEIVVAPGTYAETIDFKGKHLVLRSSGGRDVTSIDASFLPGSVVTVNSCESATIEGLTIAGGDGTLIPTAFSPVPPFTPLEFEGGGGGIYSARGSVTISQCCIRENRIVVLRNDVTARGGGLYAQHAIVTSTRFENNSLVHGAPPNSNRLSGGGAYVLTGEITDCEFVANEAAGFSHNDGGGLYAGPDVKLIGCLFENNNAPDQEGDGGAVWGGASFERCLFYSNHAGFGGAFGGAGQSVRNCVFLGNTASDGGVYWGFGSGGIDYVNCVFNANLATGFGATNNCQACAPITHVNCTAVNNVAQCVTVCAPGSNFDLGGANNITWNNQPGIGDGLGDPLFVDADGADNIAGTQDDDLRLSPGSPRIDSGDNAAVPPDVLIDLADRPRFLDDPDTADTGSGTPPIVDQGAFEFVPCAADLDGNGEVGFADLTALLVAWGPCPPGPACPADLSGNGEVGFADLTNLLINWGACP